MTTGYTKKSTRGYRGYRSAQWRSERYDHKGEEDDRKMSLRRSFGIGRDSDGCRMYAAGELV